jgi:hypothetical protein
MTPLQSRLRDAMKFTPTPEPDYVRMCEEEKSFELGEHIENKRLQPILNSLEKCVAALESVNQFVKDNKTYAGNHGQHHRILEFVDATEALSELDRVLGEK